MWKIKKLGKIEYLKALEYQNHLVKLKKDGLEDNFLLLLEHYPVFTMGKGADRNNILDKNIPIIIINRGGDLTYHGPDQLIGYIIMDLKSQNLDVHQYLRKIEDLIIEVLKEIDIQAYKVEKLTGVWANNKKLASIGIGVKKGITMHGFALNVNPDLSNFSKINPCGLNSNLISSIKELKKSSISLVNIENLVIEKFLDIFAEEIK
ncbi:MAG: lipoyl(octanoyl) transferase [Candidatus Melainabacteria bacterium RIFOXYA12_FULL_32_12]|nr:MAG: lipoyl(octanoyl) transferase [Candidatus Melainabacteria bacterium RIFOXYA2_FULL_32_9]OGI30132.1 MAG: lipoyl(octanoyl) transferase [Candidatus Melainabacteria bacterium RIFOXYA12_FULL_32_12]